jgi:hypothetical protein
MRLSPFPCLDSGFALLITPSCKDVKNTPTDQPMLTSFKTAEDTEKIAQLGSSSEAALMRSHAKTSSLPAKAEWTNGQSSFFFLVYVISVLCFVKMIIFITRK